MGQARLGGTGPWVFLNGSANGRTSASVAGARGDVGAGQHGTPADQVAAARAGTIVMQSTGHGATHSSQPVQWSDKTPCR